MFSTVDDYVFPDGPVIMVSPHDINSQCKPIRIVDDALYEDPPETVVLQSVPNFAGSSTSVQAGLVFNNSDILNITISDNDGLFV